MPGHIDPDDPELRPGGMSRRTLGPLFEQPAPSHRDGPETERLAAERVHPALGARRLRVQELVDAAGRHGLTGAELCAHFPDLPEHAVRPRLTELASPRFAQTIVQTARTRRNARGNAERVWIARSCYLPALDDDPDAPETRKG